MRSSLLAQDSENGISAACQASMGQRTSFYRSRHEWRSNLALVRTSMARAKLLELIASLPRTSSAWSC